MRRKIVKDLVEVGKFLFQSGVVDYYSGNLSVFRRGKIYITRSGSPLPLLTEFDILEIDFKRPIVGKPSSEFIVHKAVYEKTDKRAVAHAHPPSVVALSFNLEVYTPRDSEVKTLLGDIPVLVLDKPSASKELAEAVSEVLKTKPCAIVRSHGVFCGAENIFKAAGFITALEFSAKVYRNERI